MNTTTPTTTAPQDYHEIVKKAFILWESFETFSDFLWNTFGDDFIKLDEMREIRQQCLHLENTTDLPF